MRLVLDAGALIAIDRHDRRVAGIIELGRRAGASLVTSAPVVGQAWRGHARQSNLARHLAMVDTRVVDVDDARTAGALLAETGTSDVVDALLAGIALPGDRVLTSDRSGLERLLSTRGVDAMIVDV